MQVSLLNHIAVSESKQYFSYPHQYRYILEVCFNMCDIILKSNAKFYHHIAVKLFLSLPPTCHSFLFDSHRNASTGLIAHVIGRSYSKCQNNQVCQFVAMYPTKFVIFDIPIYVVAIAIEN